MPATGHTQTDEHKAKISAAAIKKAQQKVERKVNVHLIDQRQTYVDTEEFRQEFKGSNYAVQHAQMRLTKERIECKVNEDGTYMSDEDQIKLRERTGFGKADTIKNLKAKLAAKATGDTSGLSDEEALNLAG